MTKQEFDDNLKELALTQKEFGWLLDINPRTLRRWFEPSGRVPPAVANLLRAWKILNISCIPWLPMEKMEALAGTLAAETADDQAGS